MLLFMTLVFESEVTYFILNFIQYALILILVSTVISWILDLFGILEEIPFHLYNIKNHVKRTLSHKRDYTIPRKDIKRLEKEFHITIFAYMYNRLNNPISLDNCNQVVLELLDTFSSTIDSLRAYNTMRKSIKTSKAEKEQINKIYFEGLTDFTDQFIEAYLDLDNNLLKETKKTFKRDSNSNNL